MMYKTKTVYKWKINVLIPNNKNKELFHSKCRDPDSDCGKIETYQQKNKKLLHKLTEEWLKVTDVLQDMRLRELSTANLC